MPVCTVVVSDGQRPQLHKWNVRQIDTQCGFCFKASILKEFIVILSVLKLWFTFSIGRLIKTAFALLLMSPFVNIEAGTTMSCQLLLQSSSVLLRYSPVLNHREECNRPPEYTHDLITVDKVPSQRTVSVQDIDKCALSAMAT